MQDNNSPYLMPYTMVAVMLPNGRKVSAEPNTQTKLITFDGLENGPVMIRYAEAHAIRQILNTMLPDLWTR